MVPADVINSINQLQEHITELIECLRNNKSEASNLLLSGLDMIVESVINENKLPAKNINLILYLIAEFQIKEAFQHLDIVLLNGKVSYFTFEVFVHGAVAHKSCATAFFVQKKCLRPSKRAEAGVK